MIPYSQAIYSSSRQASSKKEFAPNFQKNNKQIIALFAPKPIQSRTSSNQYFASKNETFDQSKNSL